MDSYSYVYVPGPVVFSLVGLTNPITADRNFLGVSTYSVADVAYLIDQSKGLFNLTFTTGLITIHEITPLTTEINAKTGNWKISLQAQHEIAPTYRLRLIFPSELQVQQVAGCNVIGYDGTNIDSGYACNADGAFN